MNKFELLGRVGKVDITYKESGTCFTQISIGVTNGKKNTEGKKLYDNFYITFFNTKNSNTAERLAEEVKEGDYIRVEGKLTDNVYTPQGAEKPKHSLQLIGWGFCKVVFDEATRKYVDVKKEDGVANEEKTEQPKETTIADDEEIPF